jgi:hypothetical protein
MRGVATHQVISLKPANRFFVPAKDYCFLARSLKSSSPHAGARPRVRARSGWPDLLPVSDVMNTWQFGPLPSSGSPSRSRSRCLSASRSSSEPTGSSGALPQETRGTTRVLCGANASKGAAGVEKASKWFSSEHTINPRRYQSDAMSPATCRENYDRELKLRPVEQD